MKKTLTFLFVLCATVLIAQEKASNFSGRDEDRSRNPRMDQMNYVPNEVLLKFKDEVTVTKGSRIRAAGINNVDNVLQNYGVSSLEKLFPTVEKPSKPMKVKGPQGKEIKVPRIDNIYRINIPQEEKAMPANIHQMIEELKALPEIEYAEPNYIYSIDDVQPVGPELTADDLAKMAKKYKSDEGGVTPNDPLYPQQWYIPAVKADLVWEQTTGDSTQVIAILDTGVDWTHPDLKNKIWRNPGEITGNGIDDDGNGFVDDYMGWDFINNDNNPMDDNSHGTHVAGIAAAEANNGIGIAGVNWQAKIMPIKVFQSSGRGDAATITQGIVYAYQKGATVINMSFGSYARSLTMENALANAYATTILVAAAGNDGVAIGPCDICAPFFPAALSFVLGTESPEASFSNYDQDGPTYSEYLDLLNYEMKAPGTNIISTIPNGNYRVYQGTSMATPIVSGALALYRNLISYEDESSESMWVKLIQSTEQYLDIHKALTLIPKPEVWFINKVVVDTLGNADRDGRVDAGERIQLWFKARNTGGQVDSAYWKIRLAEFEDTTTCKIIKPTSYIGSISPYATRTNENDPMEIKISPDITHDRDITFDLLSWFKESNDTVIQRFSITAENGTELMGVMDTTLILTSDKLWIVNSSFKVGQNGIMKIEPGTQLILNKNIENLGYIYGIGKKDSLIFIKGPRSIINSRYTDGKMNFKYVTFSGMTSPFVGDSLTFKNCIFEDLVLSKTIFYVNNNLLLEDNIIRNSIFGGGLSNNPDGSITFYKNNIINCLENYNLPYPDYRHDTYDILEFNNFIKIKNFRYETWGDPNSRYFFGITNYSNKENNVIEIGKYQHIFGAEGENDIIPLSNIYWGTTNITKIKSYNYDFWIDTGRPMFSYDIRTEPTDSAHAIVWKVLVNGKDAQDEVVEPVSVGKQRFDVYFNREMDKTIIPQVSFGVREPYNQQSVNEDGIWSEDGKIYTVYKTIKLTTGDGINRIRVSGAKDLEEWEIPTEDMRFEFVIAATSSASIEFMATPGLGKVELEWNDNDLEDGLGYNMYRMEHINDSTLTQPVIVNSSLITDTLYTDFNVVPNKKYYYYYKILRTNMVETDSSRVVAAIPFTAAKGDANGDLTVDVLDVTTIVAYLLNNNPQPFIYDAADVNSDEVINVLDIVGVVNLVLDVPQHAPAIATTKQVDLYMQNDTLFADSNVDIGAIQLDIPGMDNFESIEILDALKAFESGNSYADGSLRVIFYSMSGKAIEPGQAIPLLKLKAGSTINHAVFGEPTGSSIPVNYIKTRIPDIRANMNQNIAELGQNYPNPANGLTTIPIRIYEPVDEIVLRVVNMMGQEVDVIRITNPILGENLIQWNPVHNKGLLMYKLEIRQGNNRSVCPAKRMMVQ